MKSKIKIAVVLLLTSLLFQCKAFEGSRSNNADDQNLRGKYQLTKIIIADEGITLDTKQPDETYRQILSQVGDEYPDLIIDSMSVRQKVEGNLNSLSTFAITFGRSGHFQQTKFDFNEAFSSAFEGKYELSDGRLIIYNSEMEVHDIYEGIELSDNTLTLVQRGGDAAGGELIIVLQKVR